MFVPFGDERMQLGFEVGDVVSRARIISSSFASSANGHGISSARLFPHFWTRVLMFCVDTSVHDHLVVSRSAPHAGRWQQPRCEAVSSLRAELCRPFESRSSSIELLSNDATDGCSPREQRKQLASCFVFEFVLGALEFVLRDNEFVLPDNDWADRCSSREERNSSRDAFLLEITARKHEITARKHDVDARRHEIDDKGHSRDDETSSRAARALVGDAFGHARDAVNVGGTASYLVQLAGRECPIQTSP